MHTGDTDCDSYFYDDLCRLKICFLGARSVYLHSLWRVSLSAEKCVTVKGMARQTSFGVFKKQKMSLLNLNFYGTIKFLYLMQYLQEAKTLFNI